MSKYILDFAFLKIDKHIGDGASAHVYSGTFKGNIEVAIRVNTYSDLTEDEIMLGGVKMILED